MPGFFQIDAVAGILPAFLEGLNSFLTLLASELRLEKSQPIYQLQKSSLKG